MPSSLHYGSKLLKHLGLVSGMCDELGISDMIDRALPQDKTHRIVSIGQSVKAMILNGLGFASRALYLTPHFFEDKPVERLLGEGIEAAHLNDDTLGRALDEIYDYGPEQLYTLCAAQAVNRLDLSCNCGHIDSTSFHSDGQHNSDEQPQEEIIHITKGYSRDHRPDLNQVVLQLICEGEAGIPLLMVPLNGNSSDKTGFRDTIKNYIGQMHSGIEPKYLIGDSAMYTAETIKEIGSALWISRVPETLNLAGDIIKAVVPEIANNPKETASISLGVVYGGVKQRWVVVYSPESQQRAIKTINKHCLSDSSKENKEFEALCKQEFACEADALKALAAFEKKLNATFLTNTQVQKLPRFKARGRPAKANDPDYYIYRIDGAIASKLSERQDKIQRKSCFILATNQLDSEALSAEELLAVYKNQQKVERGFRFLKDPMFMASTLFLKSPKRIMALMMVMTLCLMVYAALEHRIREALQKQKVSFPNQKGKLIQNPTARWVFQFFSGIHVLVIDSACELVLNLKDYHIILLELLGKRYKTIYSDCG